MRIGLLVCDHVREEFIGISGDYEDMFIKLFRNFPEVEVAVYDALAGELPDAPDECDAWLTTGSRYSVNDEEQWIRDLERFVREVADAHVPLVGVCFGHQLIAKALGGSVVKSDRGWGVGVKEVQLAEGISWTGSSKSARLLTSYQDQVDTLPPGADVLGWNEHCPVAMMSVGPSVLGIQGHPEMDSSYVEALLHARRGSIIPEDVADTALDSLVGGTDSGAVAGWILDFIAGAPGRETPVG